MICNICNIDKNSSEFNGRSRYCKTCHNQKVRDLYRRNKEKWRDSRKNWVSNNSDKIKN